MMCSAHSNRSVSNASSRTRPDRVFVAAISGTGGFAGVTGARQGTAGIGRAYGELMRK